MALSDLIQLTLTLKMTTAQVVKKSVTVNNITVLFRTAFTQMIMIHLFKDVRKEVIHFNLHLMLFYLKVTEKNLDSFLDTSVQNKPSVILFSPKSFPSLLYCLVAFGSYKWQSFGFVSLTHSSTEPLRKRFHADFKEPSLMIFKDDIAAPEVVIRVFENIAYFLCIQLSARLAPNILSLLFFVAYLVNLYKMFFTVVSMFL